jgi:hypothetical protein
MCGDVILQSTWLSLPGMVKTSKRGVMGAEGAGTEEEAEGTGAVGAVAVEDADENRDMTDAIADMVEILGEYLSVKGSDML